MSNFKQFAIIFLILGAMFFLAFFSARGDSAIVDESPHIAAGYSYLRFQDYRLNPEHPPLIKDLASLPLQFLKLNFPIQSGAWQKDINGQWTVGHDFLYNSGNNPDQIIFWARLPMILFLTLFGFVFFVLSRNIFGPKVALLATFLLAFSPTFLAHGRLVTTDLGATFGIFLATIIFIKFLQNPSNRNLFFAGLALGFAELLKFSTFLLIPYLALLIPVYALLSDKKRFINYYFQRFFLILVIAYLLVLPIYVHHTFNYPIDREIRDTKNLLGTFGSRALVNFDVWLASKPILRAWGHYGLGLLMVLQRAAGGNTAFFVGQVTNKSWLFYFPLLYLLKEQLGFHILTLIAIIVFFIGFRKKFLSVKTWLQNNFVETAFWIFIILYWANSILGNLNIGIRHILPTLPFIYLLVSKGVISWFNYSKELPRWHKKAHYIFLAGILIWYAANMFLAYPAYLSYYNELIGGSKNGYKIAVDSNYDWGQDLKRLSQFVKKNKIKKIAVDYFGGGDPNYYLGKKFVPWSPDKGPAHGWFAISASIRQGDRGKTVKGFVRKPAEPYLWLDQYQPINRVGDSIFIYNLP